MNSSDASKNSSAYEIQDIDQNNSFVVKQHLIGNNNEVICPGTSEAKHTPQ